MSAHDHRLDHPINLPFMLNSNKKKKKNAFLNLSSLGPGWAQLSGINRGK